jgi:leucine-rich PPR motif-containing protein
VIEEMAGVGLKPNLKTYTTLIKGWARASLPDRALKCFEEMKLVGLKPDEAAYHCLVTSLLSRASVMEGSTYTGVLSVCREMFENDLTVDMRTAVHWSRWLHKIERTGGALTEALQRIFPPDWNSLEVLGEVSDSVNTGDSDYSSDSDMSDDGDENQDVDDN